MKYPQLVPSWTCRTPIHVELNREGVSEDGEPLLCLTADLMCNWQDSAKIVRTGEKQYTQLSGVAVFPGDIAPDLAVISSGIVVIGEETRQILQGTKARKPGWQCELYETGGGLNCGQTVESELIMAACGS